MDPDRAGAVWPVIGGPLFIREGNAFRATDYCRGPWNPTTLHGGPVVGLLAYGAESLTASSMACTRLTVEMFAPVPLDLLSLDAHVVKPGRRTMVIDSSISHGGIIVARATSLWARSGSPDDNRGPGAGGGPAGPARPNVDEDPRTSGEFDYPNPGFNCDTCDLRYVAGSHETPGSGASWVRLRSPLIEGETNSPFVMAATISDLAAAAGWEPAPNGNHYINPDVTLQLARTPVGEWLGLVAHVEHGVTGTALLSAEVFDDTGRCGRVLQSMVEAPAMLSISDTGGGQAE